MRLKRSGGLAALALLLVGASACGNLINVTYAGQVGITVDQAGQPVIAVMTCSTSTPMIGLAEGRKPNDPDDKQNVLRASWQAREGFVGVKMFTLAKPEQDWALTGDPGTLEPGELFIVDGGTVEDENATLGGVSFRIEDLARLSPNQIQLDGKIQSLSTFGAYRCD